MKVEMTSWTWNHSNGLEVGISTQLFLQYFSKYVKEVIIRAILFRIDTPILLLKPNWTILETIFYEINHVKSTFKT
jgi:hypothetical protein